MAKGHRWSTKGTTRTPNVTRDGALKVNDLCPGSTGLVDHFESRLKGRTFDSFGKATSDQYMGGYIFIDHAGISPNDIFLGTRVPRYKLRNMHMWGCPVYVLNPSLQAGKKIPHWEPQSKEGVFCGLSTLHSSEVPLVLNLSTGSITTQFHVVFNDLFTTVPSIEREDQPPSHWEDLCLENTTFIPINNQYPLPLNSEWHSAADTE